MAPIKNKWVFPLVVINSSVAMVFLIQVTGSQHWRTGELVHPLANSLVYANLTGLLGFLVLSWLAETLVIRKIPLMPIIAVGFIVLTAAGCLLAQTLLMGVRFVTPRHFWPHYLYTLRTAIPVSVIFGLGAFVHGSLRERFHAAKEELLKKELAEEKARKLASEARLRLLESRIQPHFLFNTLNSISALIAEDTAKAEQTVERLAILLRASLDNNNQPLIALQQELAMVESYVDIQKVRFGNKLRGSMQVTAELQNAKVPPMSVHTLVDNAVKHGVTPEFGGGDFIVTATVENGSLRIEVQDSGPGFDLTAIQAGRGLDNLVERLDTLFGSKAHLNSFRRDDRCVVEMVLPLV